MNLKLREGDKFTKQPVWYGKHLIMLGRRHLHVFNLTNGHQCVMVNHGEDQAESVGKKAGV